MKLCVNCKAELEDEAVFCSKCGFKQETLQGGKNKKAREKKTGKGRRGKYFVLGGVALVLVTAVSFWLMYISAQREWEEESKVWLDEHSPTEYYYLKGFDYCMASGVYESNDWKWEEDKFVDERNRTAEYADARYDAKGRILEHGLVLDTDIMNDTTYSYEENADGSLTITRLCYAWNFYMEEISQKYIYVYDNNKELISRDFYGKKQGQTGYQHVSSYTYPTLLKDGIYNREYEWWETDDGGIIWITKGTKKEEIVWIVVLDSSTQDYEMEEGVYCVTGGKSIQVLDSYDISRDMESRGEKDTRSYLHKMFERVGYNEKGNPEVLFMNDKYVEISYLDSDEKIKTVATGDIWCDDGYYMFSFFGNGLGPYVQVPKEETIEEFIKSYMEEHRLTVSTIKKEQSSTSDQNVPSEEEKLTETPKPTVTPVSIAETDVSKFLWDQKEDGTIEITGIKGRSWKEIVIPGQISGCLVTDIGGNAFSGFDKLTSIIIPDSVTEIGKNAFSGCSNLVSVELSDSVTEIGENTFSGCSSLVSIELPDSVTEIGENAFSECSSLVSIELPDSVTEIGEKAFSECSSLESIEIPEGVTEIRCGTFEGCSSLTRIKIPDGVERISGYYDEMGAFAGCSSLTSIQLPNSLKEIGEWTFYECISLTSIEIPEGVKEIGDGAFFRCSSLKDIKIFGEGLVIGEFAFAYCSNLMSIEMLYSVYLIGDNAFLGCDNLRSIIVSKYSYAEEWAKENGYQSKLIYK